MFLGTWGTGITSNDDFMDFYGDIMDEFNKGIPIQSVLDTTLKNYEAEFADDKDSLHNLYFAIAYAGWECGVNDMNVFNKVKDIIESGKDIESWKELGATKADLIKREKVLKTFLEKISTPKTNPKKPKQVKFKPAIFEKGDVLSIELEEGKYTGAIVLDNVKASDEFGCNFIVKAYLNEAQVETIDQILNAKVYDYAWYSGYRYKNYIKRIKVIGKIEVKSHYECHGIGTTHSAWGSFVMPNNDQYYCIKENKDIKNLKAFLKLSPKEIEKRQKQSVMNLCKR